MGNFLCLLNLSVKKQCNGQELIFVLFQVSNMTLIKEGSGVSVELWSLLKSWSLA